MNSLIFVLMLFVSYLLGSFPTGLLIGKCFKNIDLRNEGSRNLGATNALRVLGIKLGIITLIIDIFKGVLAVYLARLAKLEPLVIFGVFAIVGHIFSVFVKFKGGKGVATSVGVFFSVIPIPSLFAFLGFLVIVFLTKYVSLGSIIGALILFIIQLFFSGYDFSDINTIFTAIIVVFIVFKHRGNISRLIRGTENKLSFKKMNK